MFPVDIWVSKTHYFGRLCIGFSRSGGVNIGSARWASPRYDFFEFEAQGGGLIFSADI